MQGEIMLPMLLYCRQSFSNMELVGHLHHRQAISFRCEYFARFLPKILVCLRNWNRHIASLNRLLPLDISSCDQDDLKPVWLWCCHRVVKDFSEPKWTGFDSPFIATKAWCFDCPLLLTFMCHWLFCQWHFLVDLTGPFWRITFF